MTIQQIQPPALPLATEDYLRTYQDQLNNVLRLYFNRMSNGFNGVIGTRGGQYLDFPYGAIQRTTDKSFTANTATQITFDQNDFLNGMRNNGTDGITVEQSGIYNYQFSVQLRNSDTQIHSAWIWLRVNNVDVAGTGSKFDVIAKHGGVDGFIIAACNFYIEAEAGDTVEMWAAVSNTAVTFDASGAQTSPFHMPSIPSVVATLSFVSQKG
jgi:hypothetical protein